MFQEFLRYLGYLVFELLPLGAEGHSDLINYYFGYSTVDQYSRTLCLSSLSLGLFIYFYSDIYKLFKELFKGTWLILIGRGTVHQVCTEFKYLNLLISIIGMAIAAVVYSMFSHHFEQGYYFVGGMLILSGVVLRASETFAFIKVDGKLLGYREFFSFFIMQILSSFPGASRMALMMGSGKFMGVEKKHLIKFVFISFIPVLVVRLAFNIDSFYTLYSVLYGHIWMFAVLTALTIVLTAVFVRVFNSVNFYKFYYYLIGLGVWTILDVFFSKKGL